MKVLALDSSGLVASVAIVTEEIVLAEYTVNFKKTHSQTLLPMLDEIVRMVELDMSETDAIAVAAGPGSFTGLRIGSATAKGLGLALNKPVVSVPTLEAIAYGIYQPAGLICPMLDARRNQVYTGLYGYEGEDFQVISGQKAVDIQEIIDEMNEYGRQVILLGDGTPIHRESLEQGLRVPYQFAPAHLNRQRAASVGALGIKYLSEGKGRAASQHQPVYLRMSQAEREREERLKTEDK